MRRREYNSKYFYDWKSKAEVKKNYGGVLEQSAHEECSSPISNPWISSGYTSCYTLITSWMECLSFLFLWMFVTCCRVLRTFGPMFCFRRKYCILCIASIDNWHYRKWFKTMFFIKVLRHLLNRSNIFFFLYLFIITGVQDCLLYIQTPYPADYLADNASVVLIPDDSEWKTKALQRIEDIRKAYINITWVFIKRNTI